MNQIDLAGQVAVITGAALGIGLACARRFLDSGASVCLWDKDAALLQSAVAELDADGRAEVFHSEGSGLIGGLSWSDGLVELAEPGGTIRPGDPVRYLPYAGFGPGC